MKRILLLGAPGSGKGTQAEGLCARLGIPVLGSGNLLRAEIARESDLGTAAKRFVESGKLVPDELIVAMMKRRMEKPDARKGFLLDGFPRTLNQAESLDRILDELGVRLECVLEIDVDEEMVIGRMSSRRICEANGHVFNLLTHPPKRSGVCDHCGGRLVTRADDRPETIRQRLEVYRRNTEPLIRYYESRGVLRKLDGTGSVEEVLDRAVHVLSEPSESAR